LSRSRRVFENVSARVVAESWSDQWRAETNEY